MHKRLASSLTVASAVALVLGLDASSGFAGKPSATPAPIILAQSGTPPPTPSNPGPDPAGVLDPKTYKETPAEVAECMKNWDPQTGMSKEEFEASCRRTLKYFPEKDD